MKKGKIVGILLMLVGFFLGPTIDQYMPYHSVLYEQSLGSILSWSVVTFQVTTSFFGLVIGGAPIGVHILVIIGLICLLVF